MKLSTIIVIFALVAIAAASYCTTDSDCGKKLAKCKKAKVICRCHKTFCSAKLKCTTDKECPPFNKCMQDSGENTQVCQRPFSGFRRRFG